MADVVRDAAGKAFSSWKSVAKFEYVLGRDWPEIAAHVLTEYIFDSERKWRLDFAWPTQLVGVEIDGFGFSHQAVDRLSENHEKQNAAVELGWRILRYTSKQLGSKAKVEEAVDQVCRILCNVK